MSCFSIKKKHLAYSVLKFIIMSCLSIKKTFSFFCTTVDHYVLFISSFITILSIFRPLNVKKNDKASSRTVARYPVRSGPKQFASYLGDMGRIILEVLNGPMLLPVGYAEVTNIGLLSPNRPVNG